MKFINKSFDYLVWFERCEHPDENAWAFTRSGDQDDDKNLDVPELEFIFQCGFKNKEWTDTIIGVGIDDTGEADFHFSDGTVSPCSAYLNESHTFLRTVELICIGYLVDINGHCKEVTEWNEKFLEYQNG